MIIDGTEEGTPWKIGHWADLGSWGVDYRVRLINSAVMGFEVFPLTGVDDAGMKTYERRDKKSGPIEYTTDIDQADAFVYGSIKWDGCSDIRVWDSGYFHSCGRPQSVMIGLIIDRLYDEASASIESNEIDDRREAQQLAELYEKRARELRGES